ncbi:hypothetical protein [Georgenia sp. MJ170]|uniref:hypothetical protein n=1 Tax=Georgenia sunbinii TaxID=3117728 RepID=UPI002F266F1A
MFTPPLRRLTRRTTLGFAVIDFARDILGISLFPWQEWLLKHALELLPDGSPRFRTVVVLVARQNGKSTLSQVLALFWLYVMQHRLVVGTAQTLDLAEEVWAEAVELAEGTPELADMIEHVVQTNGRKSLEVAIPDVGTVRYKVQTASRKGGRGLSGDLILLDELREHQSWQAWAAVTKTTMARAHAQVWALSNAGDATSVVLRHLRRMAHLAIGDPDGLNKDDGLDLELEDLEGMEQAGLEVDEVDEALGIFEWSATPDCDKWDRGEWAQANPSLNHPGGIGERAVASACATDPEVEVFRPEVLCQWNEGSNEGPFPPGAWQAGEDKASAVPLGEPVMYCLDVEHDRTRSYIAVAGFRRDGDVHVEVVAQRTGVEWALDWFEERADPEDPLPVVVQARGAPVSSLIKRLQAIDGLEVIEWGGSELGGWCGAFYDAVRAHDWTPSTRDEETWDDRPMRVWHRSQPVLNLAATTAVSKPLGDSWAWNRKASPYGCAPLVAVTGAAGYLLQPPEDEEPWSAYEDEDAELFA